VSGSILATGHFRGGILFRAITGQLVQELILGAPSSIPLDIFRPDRKQLLSPER
jgi:glycine/D-amino acid oxidase-like deaminating enzyme